MVGDDIATQNLFICYKLKKFFEDHGVYHKRGLCRTFVSIFCLLNIPIISISFNTLPIN